MTTHCTRPPTRPLHDYITNRMSGATVSTVRNDIDFLLVVRTGGGRENVTLFEVSQEPQVGANPPHGKI